VLIEDEAGRIVWFSRVEPYGRAPLDASRLEFNMRFPGHYFDPESGLHYNRFRYYSPELGRYLQSDPEGIGGGLNLYAYTDNPLVEVDVRGLVCPKHKGRGTGKSRPGCENCQDADKAAADALEPTGPDSTKTPEDLRAESAQKAAAIMAAQSNAEHGPVLGVAMDAGTGATVPKINAENSPDGVPDNLNPVLAARVQELKDAYPTPEDRVAAGYHASEPGTHAEVLAASDLLNQKAAETGKPTTPADVQNVVVDNTKLEGKDKGQPTPCCQNCTYILQGANMQTGSTPPKVPETPGGTSQGSGTGEGSGTSET
jgi:RHS repeat-associated protein